MGQIASDNHLLREIREELRYLRAEVRALYEKYDDRLLTCQQAAKKWGVSRRTVTRWIKKGKVHPVNREGHPRFSMEEINRVMREI